MNILGIDPGFGRCGWGLIGDEMKVLEYGVIETSPSMPIEDRLLEIHQFLSAIIKQHQPSSCGIEKLYVSRNTKTIINVAQSLGVIFLTLRLGSIPFAEYTPTQVKQALTGYGHAPKEQMQTMTKRILGLQSLPQPDDAADALAIALCHLLSSNRQNAILRSIKKSL
ncbi:MAG: crossover junction endodeoxyribonuclease RuvC [Spirochaetota bacterium]